MVKSLYRPFTKKRLFYDKNVIEKQYGEGELDTIMGRFWDYKHSYGLSHEINSALLEAKVMS
ncbi:hypothetical protein GGGNBK_14210 [Sporosarcina sp. ANT_H38]